MPKEEINKFRQLPNESLCPETNEYNNCHTFRYCNDCPENGTCDNSGMFQCQSGFVKRGNQCLENEEIALVATQVVKNLQD